MALPVLEVHTPSSSFAIPHSLKGDNVETLFSRLSSKLHSNVGPGWVKYEYNGGYWDLNDDADYSIFAWRLSPSDASSPSPVIFVHDPLRPLPAPPSYQNFSYYAFRPKPEAAISTPPHSINPIAANATGSAGPFVPSGSQEVIANAPTDLRRQNSIIGRSQSVRSSKSKRSKFRSSSSRDDDDAEDGTPKYKRDFIKFHGENGNRVVIGTFGPVQKVEMLLKKGYRHVYMSRHFARRHGLVPPEVAPGWMGYGGLVNMGQIPIKLGTKITKHTVYLAEENQFDVVLGRSFMEARRVQTDPLDFSSVVCMDNGDKLECKIIVIRDGRGDFVTVP